MRRTSPIVIALLAGGAGLALNTLRPVLFTNIEWLLGGVFPLLVALVFGRWPGLLAGAITFSLTTHYWLHPVGWIAYGLEPWFVGHLLQRRRRSLIGASFTYWLIVGTPIAAVYFHWFSYAAFPANYIALTKYPLNGLIVALIAQEIANRRSFRTLLERLGQSRPLPPLRQVLVSRFSTLTALPILLLSFVTFTLFDSKLSRAAQTDLEEEAGHLQSAVQDHLTARSSETVDLAALNDRILRPQLSAGRELFLLDAAGAPLLIPTGLTIDDLERVLTPTFLDAVRFQQGHFTHDRWHPAERRMERFRALTIPIAATGWTLTLEEPLWDSQAEAVRLFLGTLAVGVFAIGLVYVLSRATAAEITVPLQDLARHTAALSRGEVPAFTRTTLPVAAELKQIQDDVSSAATTLGHANQDLAAAVAARDRSHAELQRVLGQLEQTVRERTADLQAALAAAESADRAKGEFLGMMSHELRTPLNVMLGSVELLLTGEPGTLPENHTRSLRLIQDNGQHLLSLIEDVLDFSRDAAGRLSLHREALDPGAVCEAALRLIEPQARRKSIALSGLYEHRPARLSADPRRLRQMVINLLANAIKFTPAGGRVELRVHAPAPGLLRISVSDTGIGIPPDRIEEIFTPFHQLDRALSREFEGSGLGLTLVRRLVELHGGQVSVDSTPGRGSAFHLDFPLSSPPLSLTAAAPPASPPDPTPAPAALPADPAGSPRVLIVEDNVTNAELIRSYLTRMGCASEIAPNGAAGVERAAATLPDLILMDVQMPVMDGIEATRLIRAQADSHRPRPPIVMVTALASPADRQRAFEAGADDYLTKPFSLGDFRRMVQRHLPDRIAGS